MVPNKLVHSGILPLEHERAYARLLGKLEYFSVHSGIDLRLFGAHCTLNKKGFLDREQRKNFLLLLLKNAILLISS